jgi:serine O-acetyltransferase
MIQSKQDYDCYLEADRIALGKGRAKPRFFGDDIWKFERLLRKAEYYQNCKNDIISKIYRLYLRYKLYKLSLKFGFFIPENTFGPGLAIAFISGPIIAYGKIGSNCRISQSVTIGRAPGKEGMPKIGNNVFIAPGVVIVGPIEIADDIAIGANSYVNKSFPEKGITIAGNPAKKILDTGSERVIDRATEIVKKYSKHKPS